MDFEFESREKDSDRMLQSSVLIFRTIGPELGVERTFSDHSTHFYGMGQDGRKTSLGEWTGLEIRSTRVMGDL